MKKIISKFKELRGKVYAFYRTKSTKEIVILTALLMFGYWWPVGSCIIYIVLAFYKYGKYRVYGLFSVIGAAIAMIYAAIVILLQMINNGLI